LLLFFQNCKTFFFCFTGNIPVEILQCWESIRDNIIYPHIKFWWYRITLNFCGIVVAILKMATRRNCSMSGHNSGHHYLTTYQIVMKSDTVDFFQNGHHNTTQFQHCPISSQFDMWVDNVVANWFPTLNNFYWSPFSKWPPQYRKNSTFSIFCDIVVAILKMATSRNCSMSGLNSGHHYLTTYQIVMISDNVEF
jgi:hypothetical protein